MAFKTKNSHPLFLLGDDHSFYIKQVNSKMKQVFLKITQVNVKTAILLIL